MGDGRTLKGPTGWWFGVLVTGIVLNVRRTTGQPLLDNFLLVGGGTNGSLFQLSLEGEAFNSIHVNAGNVVGVDYDPLNKKVYWTDTTTHGIYRCNLDGTEVETLITLTAASSLEGVAVDSAAGLLFYSDSGRGTVSLLSLATLETQTLYNQAKHPRTVRLDRPKYQVYWTDWGRQTIEKISYDGTHHDIIVQVPESWINGLALDLHGQHMFWTDSLGDWVNTSRIDGLERDGIIKMNLTNNPEGNSHLYGVAQHGDYLYLTDWYTSNITRIRKDGSEMVTLGPQFPRLYDILAYSQSTYISGPQSACLKNNSGCSHICVPVSMVAATCACPDNRMLLSDDATNCSAKVEAKGPDLIWLEHDGFFTGYVRGISGSPDTYLDTKEVHTWSIRSPAWHWSAVDTFYHNKMLLLLDKFDKLVVMMSLNGTKAIHGLYYGTSSEAHGLAVDWVSGNVYWTDALYNHIMVAKIEENTNMSATLIQTGLERPHGIVVHPQQGMMYWTDWGSVDKIEGATLAGQDRKVLVNKGLHNPTGLAIDFETDRLYWSNTNSIESVSLHDVTDRRLYSSFSSNYFVDIAIHQGYLFATDRGVGGSKPHLWFYRLDETDGRGVRLGLARQPAGVAMYSADQQPVKTAPCDQLQCQHLCVSAPKGGAQCLCKDGFKLAPNQQSCITDDTHVELSYIYSLGDRICSVKANDATSSFDKDPTHCIYNKTTAGNPAFEFHALDFNAITGQIYFSDAKFKVKSIRRALWSDKNNNSILIHGTGVVEGIALDWTTGHLYWTDSTYRQIWVSWEDGTHQKILAKTPESPRAMVVDPLRRKMYWVEHTYNKSRPIIRVAQMDASDIHDFVYDSLIRPTGLAIDFRMERLYWADVESGRIEYITLDGRDRVVQRLPLHRKYYPYDVAILQDYVAFTERDELSDTSGLRVVEKDTGHEVNKGFFANGKVAYDVIAADSHNQPMFPSEEGHRCQVNNGGCEQLCLQKSINLHVCQCVDGMQLQPDGVTCSPLFEISDNFFLVADDYRHQIYQLSGDMQQVSALDFPAAERPIALEYDFRDNRVYWTDFEQGVIKRAHLDGTSVQVIREDVVESRVDGLAFEAEARLLYYADLKAHIIGIMNPSGQHEKILLAEDLLQPRSLVLDSVHGHLYFSSRGKIERADMDGLNRIELVNQTLGWISGLTLDLKEELMYWCDHHAERIEVADIDGQNRKLLHQMEANADPFSLVKVADDIYWTDWNLRGLSHIRKTGEKFPPLHTDFFTGLNDIKFFSTRNSDSKSTSCSKNNGGCSHFCIPTPSGRTCACPDTKDGPTQVSEDGLTCNGVPPPCSRDVLKGKIAPNCQRHIGDTCDWACEPGFSPVTSKKLTCVQGMEWDMDVYSLCSDSSCDLLLTPDHAAVDPHCPTRFPGKGATCVHSCVEGYVRASGDEVRICRADGQWNGTNLVCIPGQPVATEATSGPSVTLTLIFALIATFVVAFISIVIIGVCLCRRSRKSGHGEVREDPPPAFTPSPDVQPAPVYDVTAGQVMLDSSLAFANPGYASHAEVTASRGGATAAAESAAPAPPPKLDDTSFVNPMYGSPEAKGGQEEGHYDTIPAFKVAEKSTPEKS